MSLDVAILSSAHWSGDARLNRHLDYLGRAGASARLTTFGDRPRLRALAATLRELATTTADVVILPDPELFFVGSMVARVRGRRAVIDIHEDYPSAAMSRSWVPAYLRPLVRVAASIAVAWGRRAAHRTLVAAPELATAGDVVVLNIPDPSAMPVSRGTVTRTLIYIGDVSEARGAIEMVDVLNHLDPSFRLLVIGSADDELRAGIERRAAEIGVQGRVELTGRLDHEEAWARAETALAGLSLLRPAPAYREAVATKLWEYMAKGLPPIVSDLPGQRRLVDSIDPRLVCATTAQVAEIATLLADDVDLRSAISQRCREIAEAKWSAHRPDEALQTVLVP